MKARIGLLVVLLVAAALSAQADTVIIASQGTAADPGEWNNNAGVSPNVCILPQFIPGPWAVAPGSCWVSWGQTGTQGGQPNNTVVSFFQSFFLPYGTNTGSLTVWADDTAQVLVNGVLVFGFNPVQNGACAAGPIGCQQLEGGVINLTGLPAGWNMIQIDVKQVGGDGFGTLYYGQVNSVPEPASLLLMGTGLLALAGVARKRVHR